MNQLRDSKAVFLFVCISNLLVVPSNLSLTALHTFSGVKGETGRLTV